MNSLEMIKNQFSIEVRELHWLGEESPQCDLCAHAQVKVEIGGETILEFSESNWTVSATALLLLRTLNRNHTKDNPVGDKLIPCCGHFFVYTDDMDEVDIGNCNIGFDWEVIHVDNEIVLRTESGTEAVLGFDFYKKVVLQFSDEIEQFYLNSEDKVLPTDDFDRKGYLQFRKEWKEHRAKWN
jgi:hypothetical protein